MKFERSLNYIVFSFQGQSDSSLASGSSERSIALLRSIKIIKQRKKKGRRKKESETTVIREVNCVRTNPVKQCYLRRVAPTKYVCITNFPLRYVLYLLFSSLESRSDCEN